MTHTNTAQPRAVTARIAAAAAATAFAGTLALALGVRAADAAPASSKGGVVHFYSTDDKFTYSRAGQLLASPPENSEAGDVIQFTDLDYVGNHKHHAKSWTATDHGVCVFSSAAAASCFIQVAMGNSMVLVQGPLTMTNSLDLPVVGGTGIYAGIRGGVVSVNLEPNNPSSPSDVTLTLHRS
jgi:hypothetical protein